MPELKLPEGYVWQWKDADMAFCLDCDEPVATDVIGLHEKLHH